MPSSGRTTQFLRVIFHKFLIDSASGQTPRDFVYSLYLYLITVFP